MDNIQTPQDLFFYNLCAMYDTEQKLAQTLPVLAQETQEPLVRDAFMQHHQETVEHVQNLQRCFEILGRPPARLESHSVMGLKQDHDAFLQQKPAPAVLTMFDLEAGTKSEYLEMAAYHGLINAANALGLQQCVPLFQKNLQQEEAAAQKMEQLARQFGMQQATRV